MRMSEKEKMRQGLWYNPNDAELADERQHAKSMCYAYNQLHPHKQEARRSLLKLLLGGVKRSAVIEPCFYCDYGYNIRLGHNFYANHNCVMLDPAEIIFGDNVFIGPNCGFYTAEHPVDAERRSRGLEMARPIKIGDNVWIGGHVAILPGVTVGSNVVIGAGSVVTKSIPPDSVAYGNPCRVQRPPSSPA